MTIQIILALFFAVPLYLFLLFAHRSPKELLTIGKGPESEYDISPRLILYWFCSLTSSASLPSQRGYFWRAASEKGDETNGKTTIA